MKQSPQAESEDHGNSDVVKVNVWSESEELWMNWQ